MAATAIKKASPHGWQKRSLQDRISPATIADAQADALVAERPRFN